MSKTISSFIFNKGRYNFKAPFRENLFIIGTKIVYNFLLSYREYEIKIVKHFLIILKQCKFSTHNEDFLQ